MSKMVPIKIIDLANLQVYVFLMVKPANIKSANISDSYKKAFLAAYKEAKNEDEGYFFEPAKAIIGYLLGISSEAPNSQLNAIDLASLVDADTLWDEIDDIELISENTIYVLSGSGRIAYKNLTQ